MKINSNVLQKLKFNFYGHLWYNHKTMYNILNDLCSKSEDIMYIQMYIFHSIIKI